jgi:putative glycerol-1-phosphate prenyltransferase
MSSIYKDILLSKAKKKKLLAVLIDPEKVILSSISELFDKIHQSIATHIFVGGSTDENHQTEKVVTTIKKVTSLPVILFPGDVNQITNKADGILFLSLLSGRNPEYLIEQQIKSVPILSKSDLEIIPTGYVLIDGQRETAVQKVSNTKPIPQSETKLIIDTALAGQYSGKKLIYLEAGSGAIVPADSTMINLVANSLQIPLIVGGGIKSKQQLNDAFNAGADMVVIGTAFENDVSFFNELKKQ